MKQLSTLCVAGLTALAFYIFTTLASSCAQIGMPVGGPRDSLPPVLLNATPPNGSVNFSANRITLTFDEYIQLENPTQNVLVSPLPKRQPFIDYRLRTVTVRIHDTLQPAKTYSIQFGNSIRDLNENNPLRDFDYVFSTGAHIDSLTVSGKVTLAETGKIDSTLTILLYSDLGDSAVYKTKPEYITRLNKDGEFRFRYLSPGRYNIFALKDESGQYMYNNPEQMFAFGDSTLTVDSAKKDIQLFAYQEQLPQPKAGTARTDTALSVVSNLKGNLQELITPLTLTFNHPLTSFDSSAALLTDTLFRPVPDVSYSVDSTGKIVKVQYAWQGSTDFLFILPATAATDTSGRHLAANDTLRFRTKNESDYGTLRLNFKNLEKYLHPVLQLVPESGEMESYPLISNVFQKKLLVPGTYYIHILEDRNENGKWDPGNYAERRQPEIVHRIPEPLTIRANWENEKDIEL